MSLWDSGNIFKTPVSGVKLSAELFKIWLIFMFQKHRCSVQLWDSNIIINAKVPDIKTMITREAQTEPPTVSESVFFRAGECVCSLHPESHHGDFQQQQTTPDVISSAPSMWAKWKNRRSNQRGPMIPSELWRNDKYSQPHISHAMSRTHKHTHIFTPFLHVLAGSKYRI